MKIQVLDQLENIDVLSVLKETGAVLEGHFKLSSGLHSGHYLQCAKLIQHPDRTSELIDAAIKQYNAILNSDSISKVISPAIGGLLFGYMLAYRIGTKMIFTERKEGRMELRRGFEIEKGEKIFIAEDVITTGGSVSEVIKICENLKADIKGIICIVDRSENLSFNYPYYYLIKMDLEKFSAEECPLCKQNMEIYYPGSRTVIKR